MKTVGFEVRDHWVSKMAPLDEDTCPQADNLNLTPTYILWRLSVLM